MADCTWLFAGRVHGGVVCLLLRLGRKSSRTHPPCLCFAGGSLQAVPGQRGHGPPAQGGAAVQAVGVQVQQDVASMQALQQRSWSRPDCLSSCACFCISIAETRLLNGLSAKCRTSTLRSVKSGVSWRAAHQTPWRRDAPPPVPVLAHRPSASAAASVARSICCPQMKMCALSTGVQPCKNRYGRVAAPRRSDASRSSSGSQWLSSAPT